MKRYSIADVLIFDNGGKTADRFTVCFPWDKNPQAGTIVACVGMGETPFAPNGFCQHSNAMVGEHLGKRINYVDLNNDCAKVIRNELAAYNRAEMQKENDAAYAVYEKAARKIINKFR